MPKIAGGRITVLPYSGRRMPLWINTLGRSKLRQQTYDFRLALAPEPFRCSKKPNIYGVVESIQHHRRLAYILNNETMAPVRSDLNDEVEGS
jgi:hypothetical protein